MELANWNWVSQRSPEMTEIAEGERRVETTFSTTLPRKRTSEAEETEELHRNSAMNDPSIASLSHASMYYCAQRAKGAFDSIDELWRVSIHLLSLWRANNYASTGRSAFALLIEGC